MTDEPQPASNPRQRVVGFAVMGGAIVLALGVVLFFVLASGDGDSRAGVSPDQTPSPFDEIPGAPTPATGTGVLEPNRPAVGEVAPNFALPDARQPSRVRQLTEFRGKVVVLNFWATWCGPCKREMPEFERAQQALPDDVVVLALNFRESPEKAVGFLDDVGATFPALIDGGGKVAEHYRVPGLPVTYFLDRDGIVRHVQVGEVTVSDLEKYLTEAGAPYKAAAE